MTVGVKQNRAIVTPTTTHGGKHFTELNNITKQKQHYTEKKQTEQASGKTMRNHVMGEKVKLKLMLTSSLT